MRLNFVRLFLLLAMFAVLNCGTTEAQVKKLAPGVLKVIPAEPDVRDSYSLPTALPGLTSSSFEGNFVSGRDTLHGQQETSSSFVMYGSTSLRFLDCGNCAFARTTNSAIETFGIWFIAFETPAPI